MSNITIPDIHGLVLGGVPNLDSVTATASDTETATTTAATEAGATEEGTTTAATEAEATTTVAAGDKGTTPSSGARGYFIDGALTMVGISMVLLFL